MHIREPLQGRGLLEMEALQLKGSLLKRIVHENNNSKIGLTCAQRLSDRQYCSAHSPCQ